MHKEFNVYLDVTHIQKTTFTKFHLCCCGWLWSVPQLVLVGTPVYASTRLQEKSLIFSMLKMKTCDKAIKDRNGPKKLKTGHPLREM